jgi:succinylglutamate desuccinylase
VSFVLTNIDKVEKGGTDGHMFNEGKIGICVELGSHREYKKYTKVGIKTAHQFIQFFGLLDEKYEADNNKQIVLKASNIYKRKNKKFALTKKYSTFDFVPKNETVCIDGNKRISYKKDKYILFPSDKNDIGVEAFIMSEKI